MILSFTSIVLLFACALVAASDFSLKGDPCSKHDSCRSKLPFLATRTCSCDASCRDYGTCCHDLKHDSSEKIGVPPFRCYHRRTATPVFVKRSCAEDFRGHVDDIAACGDNDEDVSDVKNNLLVTSRRTKITYYNRHCASCSKEAPEDLVPWDIEVHCPRKEGVDRGLIERNLTFNEDEAQWGLDVEGEFLHCTVRYSPPSYTDEAKPCNPNLVSSCPPEYGNEEVRTKCSQYYAERKLKDSNIRYRNIHCAICNGVDVRQLQCPGMAESEDYPQEEGDSRETVERVFTNGHWIQRGPGRLYECSRGHTYDPFRGKCRRDERLDVVAVGSSIPDSALAVRHGSLAFLAILVLFFY